MWFSCLGFICGWKDACEATCLMLHLNNEATWMRRCKQSITNCSTGTGGQNPQSGIAVGKLEERQKRRSRLGRCFPKMLQFQLLTALVSSVKCVFRTFMCNLLFPLTPLLLPHLSSCTTPTSPSGKACSQFEALQGWMDGVRETNKELKIRESHECCLLSGSRKRLKACPSCLQLQK